MQFEQDSSHHGAHRHLHIENGMLYALTQLLTHSSGLEICICITICMGDCGNSVAGDAQATLFNHFLAHDSVTSGINTVA